VRGPRRSARWRRSSTWASRLSLDDFGTGYSSLGYLSRTRFSSIKVDRSFVQGASKGSKEAIAIIRAVVALADSLGMATTAEGVETEDEHRLVQALGCTKVQGYYFGRPAPRRRSPRPRHPWRQQRCQRRRLNLRHIIRTMTARRRGALRQG
jgi:EAL domain-containing protein (putative c-di-GMP-specific phosphodiesterase class I)